MVAAPGVRLPGNALPNRGGGGGGVTQPFVAEDAAETPPPPHTQPEKGTRTSSIAIAALCPSQGPLCSHPSTTRLRPPPPSPSKCLRPFAIRHTPALCSASACEVAANRRRHAPTTRDALKGQRPRRRFRTRLGRRLEEVATAVGGGYWRLHMPLKLALAVRETVAGRRLGALEGRRGVPAPLPMLPCPPHPLHRPSPTNAPSAAPLPSPRLCRRGRGSRSPASACPMKSSGCSMPRRGSPWRRRRT